MTTDTLIRGGGGFNAHEIYDVNDDRIHMAKIRYMESKNKALRG